MQLAMVGRRKGGAVGGMGATVALEYLGTCEKYFPFMLVSTLLSRNHDGLATQGQRGRQLKRLQAGRRPCGETRGQGSPGGLNDA